MDGLTGSYTEDVIRGEKIAGNSQAHQFPIIPIGAAAGE